MHEHEYDDAGRLVRTIVLREAEWNDDDRTRALALQEWEGGFCQCGCNQRIEDAYNPQSSFMVHTAKCQARRAIEKVRKDDREKHKDDKSGWDDGLRYYAVKAETPQVDIKAERRQRARQARGRVTADAD